MQFLDANGKPLAGGFVYTYSAGTTTPLATYTDSSEGTPNANPVVLDSGGYANIWIDQVSAYKFIVKNSKSVQQWSQDNVTSATSAFSGTGGSALITYNAGYTGASNRSQQARSLDRVSVMDFGADSTGVLDATAAFQAALNTGRGVYVPCGVYSVGSVDLIRNSTTNTLNGLVGEQTSCVILNGTSTTAAVLRYSNAGSAVYGGRIENMTINYPAGTAGAGCIAIGTQGQTNFALIREVIRNIQCLGGYSNGGTVSIDPNYRTTTISTAATMKSYGIALQMIHWLDCDISHNTFLQNGIDIYTEGSDLNDIQTNRSQASGWFIYALDSNTFGNMNKINHNDILINGGAGGAIQLNGSYYYQVYENYYENLFASAQFISTSSDRNTAFFNNKANFTPTGATTINQMYQFNPQRTDWVMNGNIYISNSNATSANALAQCNATYWTNTSGSNEVGSYLCVWKDNNLGFPAPDQPGVVTGTVDPWLQSYDNPNVMFGGSAAVFPWTLSATTGRYVIDPAKSYSWTIPLPSTRITYQPGGSYTLDMRIVARTTTSPSATFFNIQYFNGSTTVAVYQGTVNFTDTAKPQTKDLLINIPAGMIPAGSTLSMNVPGSNLEIESIQLLQVPAQFYDYGNVSGTWTIVRSTLAPVQKLTLTGDVTTIAFDDTFSGGTKGYDNTVKTFMICQDSTGGRAWPQNSWGGGLFIGALPMASTPSACTSQTFKFDSTVGKYTAISGQVITGATTYYNANSNYHWHVALVANGVSGCASTTGCLVSTGFTNGSATVAASLNTSIGLFTMQAGYVVEGLQWISSTGCSGGTIATATIAFGAGASTSFFSTAETILAANTSGNHALYHSLTSASAGLVTTLVATGDTWDHATTCSFDVYARIEQKQ